ncbi:hypothetical protein NTE_03423 [Candidatus Nitrososphaera evergladensis SR1]|uniref:Uncharacterized protein n=1 Tax=Candidatus Nitrososphaera evergladensis SR1 TaxID=1459636 RepID=A0A075MUW3_9ARCH|nr:hypothetical protein [Candidatus Nitrososphaera evergladensis]AIF85451.1 hypothetical protein NTE_03423 [Candidatus Nitrososphaera evergladensis SR1]
MATSSKTKLFAIGLAFIFFMGTIGSLPLRQASAIESKPSLPIDPRTDIDPQIIANPPTLTAAQETKAEAIALANNEVQQAASGKSYNFDGIGFIGNTRESPVKWYPIVHINVANETGINVTIDMNTGKITNVEQYAITKLAPRVNEDGTESILSAASSPSYSSDDYKGTTNPVEMFMSTQNGVPTYTPSAASMDGQVDFLLNADEYQASGNSCLPSNVYNGYFAQVGFDYPSVGGARVVYADTLTQCVPTNIGLTYTPGHYYTFRIHAYSTPSTSWRMIAFDVNTGVTAMSPSRTGMKSYLIQAGSANTSVWMENWNPPSSTSWNARFSADLQAYSDYSDGVNYYHWPSDQQYDQQCTTFYTYPHTTPPPVMSGSLVTGGTVTWSNYNMANYIPGCP